MLVFMEEEIWEQFEIKKKKKALTHKPTGSKRKQRQASKTNNSISQALLVSFQWYF